MSGRNKGFEVGIVLRLVDNIPDGIAVGKENSDVLVCDDGLWLCFVVGLTVISWYGVLDCQSECFELGLNDKCVNGFC